MDALLGVPNDQLLLNDQSLLLLSNLCRRYLRLSNGYYADPEFWWLAFFVALATFMDVGVTALAFSQVRGLRAAGSLDCKKNI